MSIAIQARTRPSRWKRWARALKLGSEVAHIVLNLRDRPSGLDWLAVATRMIALGFDLQTEHRLNHSLDPADYFDDGSDSPWVAVPCGLRELLLSQVHHPQIVEEYWDGRTDSSRVVLAKLGDDPVGWVAGAGGNVEEGPYLHRDAAERCYATLGELMWARYGCDQLELGGSGLSPAPALERDWRATQQFENLRERLARFAELGFSRSVLFVGQPGTGKSTLIRHLAGALECRSLRIQLATLKRPSAYGYDRGSGGMIRDVSTWIRTLKPDILIFDDLDRIGGDSRLLDLLEQAHAQAKFVLASANDRQRVSNAALRPGRFDELVEVEGLDRELLASMLGPDIDLAETMAGWPIAYVREFVRRRAALGESRARGEIAELAERARSNRDEDG